MLTFYIAEAKVDQITAIRSGMFISHQKLNITPLLSSAPLLCKQLESKLLSG